jgi:hypothetical protein
MKSNAEADLGSCWNRGSLARRTHELAFLHSVNISDSNFLQLYVTNCQVPY